MEYFSVNRERLLQHALQREFGFVSFSSGRAYLAAKSWALDQVPQASAEYELIAAWSKKAGFVVDDRLADAAYVRSDNWKPGAHGLQDAQGKTLPPRG
jgi:hypothetical protein